MRAELAARSRARHGFGVEWHATSTRDPMLEARYDERVPVLTSRWRRVVPVPARYARAVHAALGSASAVSRLCALAELPAEARSNFRLKCSV